MQRWRTPGVREVLLAYLLLNAVEFELLDQCPGLWPGRPGWAGAFWLLFYTWRVSRGGGISYTLVLLGTGVIYLRMILSLAHHWTAVPLVVAAICALQFLLLISPPVRARMEGRTERSSWVSVGAGLRRPPAWLLLIGLLAGALITLVALGGGDWGAIPGCRPATSAACIAYSEGYPLHWLTAVQNTPVIDKGALLKDFVQWTLLSWSGLYAGWSWMFRQPDVSAQRSVSAPTFV